MNERQPIGEVVRAIIVDPEGRVLLGRRARGFNAGKWCLFGGNKEEGETAAEAAVREVAEEAKLTFYPQPYEERLDDKSEPGYLWRVYYFVGGWEGDLEINREEMTEAVFVGPEDLDSLDITFGHGEILREFFERRSSAGVT